VSRVCQKLFQSLAHLGDHRLLIGKCTGLQLRVEQLAVHTEFEASAGGWDERQTLDALFVLVEQFRRQTDGFWLVISHCTILEFDVHDDLSPWTDLRFPAT
jgi:hypothetical protein